MLLLLIIKKRIFCLVLNNSIFFFFPKPMGRTSRVVALTQKNQMFRQQNIGRHRAWRVFPRVIGIIISCISPMAVFSRTLMDSPPVRAVRSNAGVQILSV